MEDSNKISRRLPEIVKALNHIRKNRVSLVNQLYYDDHPDYETRKYAPPASVNKALRYIPRVRNEIRGIHITVHDPRDPTRDLIFEAYRQIYPIDK